MWTGERRRKNRWTEGDMGSYFGGYIPGQKEECMSGWMHCLVGG